MVAPVVLLDAGPLGLVTNPNHSASALACTQWLRTLVLSGTRVIVPEIADYEVRRELLRANKPRGLALLDSLGSKTEFLPLTTLHARGCSFVGSGTPERSTHSWGKTIDGDMILAGQALMLGATDFVIATTNVGHLSRFVPAKLWGDIQPKQHSR